MKKYLDKSGLQHFAEEFAARVGTGGGGGTAGRIKKVGTVEDPININYINEPNSYVLSGVFDAAGLPPDIAGLMSEVPEFTLCMDISIKVGGYDEEDGYTYYVITKSIEFLSLMTLSPYVYSNVFSLDIYPEPLSQQQEDDKIDDGFIKLDDVNYIQMVFNDWYGVNLSAVPEKNLLLMRDGEGTAINLDQLLVYQGDNEETDETPEYNIIFSTSLKDRDFVEDLIFSRNSDEYKLYPQYRLSSFASMATMLSNIKVLIDVERVSVDDRLIFRMGSVEFPNRTIRDAWFAQFSTWFVYLSYTTNIGKAE